MTEPDCVVDPEVVVDPDVVNDGEGPDLVEVPSCESVGDFVLVTSLLNDFECFVFDFVTGQVCVFVACHVAETFAHVSENVNGGVLVGGNVRVKLNVLEWVQL